jgi:hypothetical protein
MYTAISITYLLKMTGLEKEPFGKRTGSGFWAVEQNEGEVRRMEGQPAGGKWVRDQHRQVQSADRSPNRQHK